MYHVTSPNEPYPSAADLASATRIHVHGNWQISARKLPISRAAVIDQLSERIGIPIPEMIFGDNEVALRHVPTGWTIRFNAEDALDAVDKTGEGRLQVAHAGDWARSRQATVAAGIRDVRPFDWSYSTTYRGTEGVAGLPAELLGGEGSAAAEPAATESTEPTPASAPASVLTPAQPPAQPPASPPAPLGPPNGTPARRLRPSTATLPLELLRRRDPIVFHDDVILYESELDDNGISVVRVKLRVMPQRLLLLCRLYMRLDHVVVRVRDTRVYIDFATDRLLREYSVREAPEPDLRRRLALAGNPPDAVTAALRDADQVVGLLPIVERSMESVDLGGS